MTFINHTHLLHQYFRPKRNVETAQPKLQALAPHGHHLCDNIV